MLLKYSECAGWEWNSCQSNGVWKRTATKYNHDGQCIHQNVSTTNQFTSIYAIDPSQGGPCSLWTSPRATLGQETAKRMLPTHTNWYLTWCKSCPFLTYPRTCSCIKQPAHPQRVNKRLMKMPECLLRRGKWQCTGSVWKKTLRQWMGS